MEREQEPQRADRFLPWVAGLLTVIALLPFLPTFAVHWDEIQLGLGARAFDLARHEPHPPGYYLFVKTAGLLTWASDDVLLPTRTLSVVAAAAWVGAVTAVMRPGRSTIPWIVAALTLPVALAPWRWFAVTGLSYMAEAAAYSLAVAAIIRQPEERRARVGTFVGVGLLSGLRPTVAPWIAAVILLGWARPTHRWPALRHWPEAVAATAVGVAAWWVPMVLESGGWAAYVDATSTIVSDNIAGKAIWAVGLSPEYLERLTALLEDTGRFLLPGVFLLPAALRGERASPLWLLAATVPFVFHALVIYDSAGYVLASGTCAYAWLLLSAARTPTPAPMAWGTVAATIGTAALLPAGPRLAPWETQDRRMEARLDTLNAALPERGGVVLFPLERWDFGLRHAALYLPKHVAVQLAVDPYFGIVDAEEQPYLWTRDGTLESVGPAQLPLSVLVGAPVRTVAFLDPSTIQRFVHPGCARFASKLPLAEGEEAALFELPPEVEAWIDHGWFVCGRGALGRVPKWQH